MKVSAQYAQEHFADILNAVDSGEEVEIERTGRPALHLVLDHSAIKPVPKRRLLGVAKGEIWLADDWNSIETNKEIEDLFENSTLFPEPHAK